MKFCSQCQTKYSDDTLKFCLQDGKPLDFVAEEKTLVLDGDSFANRETVAANADLDTSPGSEKTHEPPANRFKMPEADNASQETVVDLRKKSDTPRVANETRSKKNSGLILVVGILIGIILFGMIGGGIYIAWILFATGESGITKSKVARSRILNNSTEVAVSSSSTRRSASGITYTPDLAFDGNPRTAWAEGVIGPGVGQWIAFDFEKEISLKEIEIMPGYFKTRQIWRKNNRISTAVFKFSDNSAKIVNFPDKMEEQKIDLGGIKTKSVLITVMGYYPGLTDSKDTLISEVTFVVE